ncbi:hypothetical protein EV360DRAFT_89929 [Lentinula raphanica]|nr:hypothetical protein EV360DRAFT_89929 [Lentinula raphanica]
MDRANLGSNMDLTEPSHRDVPWTTDNAPYQTPVSAPVPTLPRPDYMRFSDAQRLPTDVEEQRQRITTVSDHSTNHFSLPTRPVSSFLSLPSLPSVANFPQSVSDTWNQRITPPFQNFIPLPNMFRPCALNGYDFPSYTPATYPHHVFPFYGNPYALGSVASTHAPSVASERPGSVRLMGNDVPNTNPLPFPGSRDFASNQANIWKTI